MTKGSRRRNPFGDDKNGSVDVGNGVKDFAVALGIGVHDVCKVSGGAGFIFGGGEDFYVEGRQRRGGSRLR